MTINLKCPFQTFSLGVFCTILTMIGIEALSRKKKLSAEQLIKLYNLNLHPEGGHYIESFRSSLRVSTDLGDRIAQTAIYFLIVPGNISRMHRVKSDEIWHFYLGGPMTVVELDSCIECGYRTTILGQDISKGEILQYTVKAGLI